MGNCELVARGDILYIGNIVGIGFSQFNLDYPPQSVAPPPPPFVKHVLKTFPDRNANKLILITLNAKIFSRN